MIRRFFVLVCVLVLSISCSAATNREPAPPPQVVRLWPGQAPGTENWSGPEEAADAELPNIGKVHVITNVTVPTLTVFRPPAGTANGAAMIVVPGGAFRALPWDLDGLETAHWLTAHGITAFVLKYRVRPPPPDAPPDRTFDDFVRRTRPARAIAVADAEQAVRLLRSHAQHYAIDPHRLGIIGFSAGAMTTMDVVRAKDAAVRPDLAVSLYGAILGPDTPPPNAPPLFIVAAQDDPELSPAKSAEIFQRWTAANLPAELHIYEKGGHGFGFRPHRSPSDRWPHALQAWLSSQGYLKPR